MLGGLCRGWRLVAVIAVAFALHACVSPKHPGNQDLSRVAVTDTQRDSILAKTESPRVLGVERDSLGTSRLSSRWEIMGRQATALRDQANVLLLPYINSLQYPLRYPVTRSDLAELQGRLRSKRTDSATDSVDSQRLLAKRSYIDAELSMDEVDGIAKDRKAEDVLRVAGQMLDEAEALSKQAAALEKKYRIERPDSNLHGPADPTFCEFHQILGCPLHSGLPAGPASAQRAQTARVLPATGRSTSWLSPPEMIAPPSPYIPPVDNAGAVNFAAESSKLDVLVTGSAAVSAPRSVVEGEPFILLLRVSPEKLSAVLASLAEDMPENKTRLGKSGVKLTPRMSATVTGIGFEISPKEGVFQAVSATEPTTWQWEARAIDTGFLTLTFTLSGALTVEGKEVSRNFYQYRQKVNVDVSPWRFVEGNWQFIVTSLLLPAAGAMWALFRKPKDSNGVRQQSRATKLRTRLQDLRFRRRLG